MKSETDRDERLKNEHSHALWFTSFRTILKAPSKPLHIILFFLLIKNNKKRTIHLYTDFLFTKKSCIFVRKPVSTSSEQPRPQRERYRNAANKPGDWPTTSTAARYAGPHCLRQRSTPAANTAKSYSYCQLHIELYWRLLHTTRWKQWRWIEELKKWNIHLKTILHICHKKSN